MPLLAMLLAGSGVACAQAPATRPFEAVTYEHEVRQDPPLHLHVVTVDLTDPRVHIVVRRAGDAPDGEWQTTLMQAHTIAERDNLDVAVNGDFFMSKDVQHILGRRVPYYVGNWARVCGWAMSDGQLWASRPCGASLIVDDHGRVSITRVAQCPPDARQIVSGLQLLVDCGRNVAAGARDDRAPRTSAGIDRQGKKLVLLVVDGRRTEYSAGMTVSDCADEMLRLGCHWALQLDGGGSSTLVMRDPATDRVNVINRPSDGHDLPIPLSLERAIANVLAVRIDRPTTQPAVPAK